MSLIYHITTPAAWKAAQQRGEYKPESLLTEGFIHCSTAEQVEPVANAFYREEAALLLLVIDPEKLTAPLQWDPPAHPAPESAPVSLHGEFPHIYGALNLDAVKKAPALKKDDGENYNLPAL